MIAKFLGLARSGLGFIPGIGSIAALANPTVIAAIVIVGAAGYFYGNHKGTSHMRAVCLAATKMAEAKASAVDREALQEQVAMLEKRITESATERADADRRIQEYEKRLQTVGADARCILTADDIGGL